MSATAKKSERLQVFEQRPFVVRRESGAVVMAQVAIAAFAHVEFPAETLDFRPAEAERLGFSPADDKPDIDRVVNVVAAIENFRALLFRLEHFTEIRH